MSDTAADSTDSTLLADAERLIRAATFPLVMPGLDPGIQSTPTINTCSFPASARA